MNPLPQPVSGPHAPAGVHGARPRAGRAPIGLSMVLLLAASGLSAKAQDEIPEGEDGQAVQWVVEWLEIDGGDFVLNAWSPLQGPPFTALLSELELEEPPDELSTFLAQIDLGGPNRPAPPTDSAEQGDPDGVELTPAEWWRRAYQRLEASESFSLPEVDGVSWRFRPVDDALAEAYRWRSESIGGDRPFPHLVGGYLLVRRDGAAVSLDSIDFGTMSPGDTASFWLYNAGSEAVSAEGGAPSVVQRHPIDLGPGDSTEVTITVPDSARGPVAEVIRYSVAGREQPFEVRVVAIAQAGTFPNLDLDAMGRGLLQWVALPLLLAFLLPHLWSGVRVLRAALLRGRMKRHIQGVRNLLYEIEWRGRYRPAIQPMGPASKEPLIQTIGSFIRAARRLQGKTGPTEDVVAALARLNGRYNHIRQIGPITVKEIDEFFADATRDLTAHLNDVEFKLERMTKEELEATDEGDGEDSPSIVELRRRLHEAESARAHSETALEQERALHQNTRQTLDAKERRLKEVHEAAVGYRERLAQAGSARDNAQDQLKRALIEYEERARKLEAVGAERDRAEGQLQRERRAHSETNSRLRTAESELQRLGQGLEEERSRAATLEGRLTKTADFWRPLVVATGTNGDAIAGGAGDAKMIEALQRYSTHAFLPGYLLAFRRLLGQLEILFARPPGAVAASKFSTAYERILTGEKGNMGVLGALKLLSDERILSTLNERLEDGEEPLESVRDVARIDARWLFERFVRGRFVPVLNQIARLYLLQRVPVEQVDVRDKLRRDGFDPDDVVCAYVLASRVLSERFGVELRTVRLFEDDYNESLHREEREANETVTELIPAARAAITGLRRGVIYDLMGVGMYSDTLGIDKPPDVIYKH